MNTHLHTAESVVDIATGRISRLATTVGHEFLGIPHGADTSGENRFRAPQRVKAWTAVPQCVSLPFKTPQTPRAIRPANAWIYGKSETSEDCLGLNVFTPPPGGQAKRPDIVWPHGGGFVFGLSGAPGFHGGNLSRAGDLAVATLNHRLKVFKFGYFGDEDEQFAQSGTAGIWDIVQALESVRDNIAI
ncbi:MAG: carboxylesterase family protein, partial [Pseudomonadota bacterium]|nr:carboxylesterase family protein [Pseudomonadota bacterium]